MTDTINVANIIDVLSYKMKNCAFSQKEALYYAKAIEQLKIGTITTVNTYTDISSAANGRLYYVVQEGRLYYVTNTETGGGVYSANIILLSDATQKQMWSWGDNRCYALGGAYVSYTPIQEPPRDKDVKSIAAGELFGSFIKENGTLWSWGNNLCGQLGLNFLGGFGDRPCQEKTYSCNWVKASHGCQHTMALKNDGTLWTWGCNTTGLLGDGTVIVRSLPVQVIGGLLWKDIAAGYEHSMGITTDNKLYSWGANSVGHLGDNTTISKSSPVQESSLSTNWCALAAGQGTGYAIKTDGSLWVWGWNGCGQLGDNTVVNKSSPVREASSSSNWCAVSSKCRFVAAIKTDGSLWTWGDNACGQLGINTIISKSSPVREISSSTNWCQVSTGNCFVAAIKTDGSLWSWGNNFCGQLGDGTINAKSSPVRESTSASNWVSVSAGCAFTLARKIRTF